MILTAAYVGLVRCMGSLLMRQPPLLTLHVMSQLVLLFFVSRCNVRYSRRSFTVDSEPMLVFLLIMTCKMIDKSERSATKLELTFMRFRPRTAARLCSLRFVKRQLTYRSMHQCLQNVRDLEIAAPSGWARLGPSQKGPSAMSGGLG
jgi:hypothetical protein